MGRYKDPWYEAKEESAESMIFLAEKVQTSGGVVSEEILSFNKSKNLQDPFRRAREGAAECTLSLARAMQQAGGAIRPSLLDTTLREFIVECAAQNHIRFVYEKPPEE